MVDHRGKARTTKWSQDVKDRFRALFLHNGNASACARELDEKINYCTASKWARNLLNDPGFQAERKALQEERALEYEALQTGVVRKAAELYEETGDYNQARVITGAYAAICKAYVSMNRQEEKGRGESNVSITVVGPEKQ